MKNTENTLIKQMPATSGQNFVIGVMSVRVHKDGSQTYKRIRAVEKLMFGKHVSISAITLSPYTLRDFHVH